MFLIPLNLETWKMRWTPLIGLFLYVFDLVSDILLAIHYWKTNEFWWFRMTLIFIGAPSVIVNITAIFQVINILSFLAAVLQLSIVFRCIEALYHLMPVPTHSQSYATWRQLRSLLLNGVFRRTSCYVNGNSHGTLLSRLYFHFCR